jgi:predicted hydrolase (HD superfamily)
MDGMKRDILLPARAEAEELLIWAHEQNPGPWTEHCRVAARAAEVIARKCGLDAERAYISGLLHDIGYYDYKDGTGNSQEFTSDSDSSLFAATPLFEGEILVFEFRTLF